jgi:hypothetical protein
MANIKNYLSDLGIDIKIHGVKKGQKIHSDWVSLQDYLVKLAKSYVNDNDYINDTINKDVAQALNSTWFMRGVVNGKFSDYVNTTKCPKAKSLMMLNVNKINVKEYDNKNKMIHFVNSKWRNILDNEISGIKNRVRQTVSQYESDINDVLQQYPLLKGMDGYSYYHNNISDETANNLTNYINAMYIVNTAV